MLFWEIFFYRLKLNEIFILFFVVGVQAKIKFDLNYLNKKSKTFIEIKENKVGLQFGGVKLHFSNLFNGNKELGTYQSDYFYRPLNFYS